MTGGSEFTQSERTALAPYFTNLDLPVFALINLPETVKGALFARYSRSAKSLRRLFLDEFLEQVQPVGSAGSAGVGAARADQLYMKIFNEYGDDSVAQLGGVHVACEDVSNLLTKVLERGRLMAVLPFVAKVCMLCVHARVCVCVSVAYACVCVRSACGVLQAAHHVRAMLPCVTSQVLESIRYSAVFRPPNPWTTPILLLLATWWDRSDTLKLNLKCVLALRCGVMCGV